MVSSLDNDIPQHNSSELRTCTLCHTGSGYEFGSRVFIMWWRFWCTAVAMVL
jgi:hypothetical protein